MKKIMLTFQWFRREFQEVTAESVSFAPSNYLLILTYAIILLSFCVIDTPGSEPVTYSIGVNERFQDKPVTYNIKQPFHRSK